MNASHSSDTQSATDAQALASTQERLRQYLVDELGADKELQATHTLFSSGVLDSFDIVQVLDFVNREFAVEISPLQVNLDNFDSIERMAEFVIDQRAG